MKDIWSVVHAEREALIDFLGSLDDSQWDAPSLCPGWSVHDVVAHLVDTAKTTRVNFVTDLARARFSFDRQNANGVARERGTTPGETLERFRAVAGRTSTPPASKETRLVEAFIHGEDIRRPLGASGDYPLPAVEQALRYQVKTPTSFGGAKDHVAGLKLVADDMELSIGDGALVSGPASALLVASSGRATALDDLDGPGVAELSRRIGATA
ncbi:maleylpyruvate isomerase family mycothiol-dependent enzyme [Luteipulveratus mongoliensis]|uniref:Actinobacterial protein n=1 Tax=Luteipulveratus mongoliensis TaxID=571913 RepID=A0A0K1JM74_9MICO|nr:maleylpyruvate isomerase family mycothiol-dependent enzyme [Luteipulveratus mongoliensis]AKU17688.1 actinobacterial protein [Luteipulveratus mongoliensis]